MDKGRRKLQEKKDTRDILTTNKGRIQTETEENQTKSNANRRV